MKRTISLLVGILCLLVLAHSCQKTPILTLGSTSTIEVPANGGNSTISFTANNDWTVRAADTWVHVSPASGAGSDQATTVTVTCDPNDTYEARSSTITVSSAGNLTKTVTVNQPANTGLLVDGKTTFDLSAEAQTFEVTVKHNVLFTVSSSADWVTQDNTKALTSTKLTFSVAENTVTEARSATVTISGDGLSQKITVNQAAAEEAGIKASDLVGTWFSGMAITEFAGVGVTEENAYYYTFNADGTFTTGAPYEGESGGTWALADGMLSITTTDGTWTVRPLLAGGNAALALLEEWQDEGYDEQYRVAQLFYKKGATVTGNTIPDGRWDAPHGGIILTSIEKNSPISASLIIEGAKADLYIHAWGFHTQSTYSLSNGLFRHGSDVKIWQGAYYDSGGNACWSMGGPVPGFEEGHDDDAPNMNALTFELQVPYKYYEADVFENYGPWEHFALVVSDDESMLFASSAGLTLIFYQII